MTDAFYAWYNALASGQQVYWAIALITSLLFLIQMVLTFIGIGDADTDMDFGGDADISDGSTLDMGGAMQLFTIRNFINFLLGLGWGGVCLHSLIPNQMLLAAASFVVGLLFVYVFLLIYRQMSKLEKDGTFHIEDCVGSVVDVYLTIPAARTGVGKVQVSFQGSVQELIAVTDDEAPIHSGAKVRVLGLLDASSVVVERI
ncbi:MAG: serine protease [Bacteroidaceae bacterium]|jgi:hypothetical protein|nr:serine protease [Bacteroidaceae bacterium]